MKLAPVEFGRKPSAKVRDGALAPPQIVSLSNGRYSLRLSEAGSGFARLEDLAVTRWSGDEVAEADGFHLYLRDLDDGYAWSAGYQPMRVNPARYEFRAANNVAEITRVDRDIECRMQVFVVPEHDFEIRLVQLANHGDVKRRIELTSYLEWVLGSQDGDANHPAFSKLFVETQYCETGRAIWARRRPRSNDDSEIVGVHFVVADDLPGKLEFETNRLRFIGRGRTLASPAAMEADANLSGDVGAVLDPVASLRLTVAIEPGESQEVAFLVGAGRNRARIEDFVRSIGDLSDVRSALTEARESGASNGHSVISIRPDFGTSIESDCNRAAMCREADASAPPTKQAELQFENGYGGFSPDGKEYVIRIRPNGSGGQLLPPMPWVNVIANERAGFLVTERGATFTWAGNSRVNRVTAWHNDPVSDPHAEAFWIRDNDAKEYWSPTPGPSPTDREYRVRHGFGYSVFEHESHELSQEVTMFIDRDEPVKIVRLKVKNTANITRHLSLFSFAHWSLGGLASETGIDVTTSYNAVEQAIYAANPHRDLYGEYVAFSAPVVFESDGCHISHTCDRAEFIGRYRDLAAPAAVASADELDGRVGHGIDPCAAWEVSFELGPGETYECAFVLGEAADIGAARKLVAKYNTISRVSDGLAQSKQFWRDTLSAITIETPDCELNLLINGWLAYQNLSCRMWARSAFYQPGGAFGFRDQLQDSSALVYLRPEISRTQILRHASRQFVEGDVLHWWHPDTEYGLRTRFSDDLLWLPLLAAEYVARTGDAKLLDEETPFITAASLKDGEQESYMRPAEAGTSASVYEHCCRAIDRGLTTGPNGLPLIGCGDWNDGFSRVGCKGRGESVWMAFFIDCVLQKMLPLCESRGDADRVARYREYRKKLHQAIDTAGWDGEWYRRAYYDNGEPIGSAKSDECQIDALVQAWAVMSRVGPAERAEKAMRAAEERLVCEDPGLIRLLTPAFNKTPNDPGYIKGYLPGIRENGGQYTHGVLWFVRAMAELGRGTRAVELLKMITPVWHTRDKASTDVYQTEPYVVAADVYGEAPHVGRGGWTWYTGSAGWMFRVAVESILGFATENGDTIVMNPSISKSWPTCRLTYQLPDGTTRFEITIENPQGKERGVTSATLDGAPVQVADGVVRVPALADGKSHHVVVTL
jgi:N,N'-diacetylchitobiose phosphorylase